MQKRATPHLNTSVSSIHAFVSAEIWEDKDYRPDPNPYRTIVTLCDDFFEDLEENKIKGLSSIKTSVDISKLKRGVQDLHHMFSHVFLHEVSSDMDESMLTYKRFADLCSLRTPNHSRQTITTKTTKI